MSDTQVQKLNAMWNLYSSILVFMSAHFVHSFQYFCNNLCSQNCDMLMLVFKTGQNSKSSVIQAVRALSFFLGRDFFKNLNLKG